MSVKALFPYKTTVRDKGSKQYRYNELKDFFNKRARRNAEYFKSNFKIVGIYNFVKSVVDNLCV